jgi:hypothetical protein
MIYPDADITNADWSKRTADLHITTRPELMAWIKSAGLTLAEFKALPVYALAPDHWNAVLERVG